ncbi:MAG: alpha/beta hydrolase [Gammaproteobacteria bacterium]|nr:alpha/beta hydrolase [Gammaproteobacteria bacterium]
MQSILFLHGGALNKEMWAPQIEELENKVLIHTIDLPGHGHLIGIPFTLKSAVNEVEKYIAKNISGNVTIVGLSLGGYVAIAYAHRHADRVNKLILSGCCTQYLGFTGLLAKVSSVLTSLISNQHFEKLQKKFLSRITTKDIVEKICSNGISKQGAQESLREVIGKDFVDMLDHYRGPTLIINGENDTLNRRFENAYLTTDANRSLVTLENCAHICNLENSDAFTNLIYDFATATHV